MYRPVPEDEPWILDIVEARAADEDHHRRAVVVGIAPGVDEDDPTNLQPAYQLILVEGNGHATFPRELLRVVEPGGAITSALEALAEDGGTARRWHPGIEVEEYEEEDEMEEYIIGELRKRTLDVH